MHLLTALLRHEVERLGDADELLAFGTVEGLRLLRCHRIEPAQPLRRSEREILRAIDPLVEGLV